jgi:NAD(P)-dependent dehydrogenase (short-subunit alcohol dehydrogenase family)
MVTHSTLESPARAPSTALITGASRGLGAALARSLAARGFAVALVARSQEALAATAAEIRRGGGKAFAVVGDLSDKRAIHRIAGEATALVGPIDLLIHNAATLGPVPLRQLAETDCEEVERALATNLVGPFRLTKALVGSMILRHHGLIVHVSSDAARDAYPDWGAYGVSKAALEHLARSWDVELSGTGVRSIVVDPGEMDTQMHAEAIPGADRSKLLVPAVAAENVIELLRAAAPELWRAS